MHSLEGERVTAAEEIKDDKRMAEYGDNMGACLEANTVAMQKLDILLENIAKKLPVQEKNKRQILMIRSPRKRPPSSTKLISYRCFPLKCPVRNEVGKP
jgi:hypothetical protein